jgi:hypothetical protein
MKLPHLCFFLMVAVRVVAEEPAIRSAPEAFEKGEFPNLFDVIAPYYEPPIQVKVEFIELSQKDATRLLYKEKLGTAGPELREALQAMIDGDQATVMETMLVTTRRGHRATGDSYREVMHGAEWDGGSSQVEPSSGGTPNVSAGNPAPSLAVPIPLVFETRNEGGSLVVVPTMGDDGMIELTLEAGILLEVGTKKWNPRKDANGDETAVEQPYYYQLKAETTLLVVAGVPMLTHVLTPCGADGRPDRSRKLLVMVTCEAIRRPFTAK